MNENVPPLKRDWGKSYTLLIVLILFLVLPNRFTIGGPIVNWTLGLVLAATVLSSFVTTAIGSKAWASNILRIGAVVLAISILASVIQVIMIIFSGKTIDGVELLQTALSIWVANVVMFATIYHWVGEREFLFPHRDGDPPAQLVFLDYLFLSFTTSTAFSPTDTAPLTTRTRMMVMVESAISLMMIALAAARAVNILT